MAKKPKIKDADLKFSGNLKPISKSKITKLVQHHMAHKTWHIKDVHNYHKNTNGWLGIGYNFWIDFDGNIYEGRGFHQGAHAKGYNSTAIGIGYQGNFDKQDMPDAQLKAGQALNDWIMDECGLSVSDIIGHNDLDKTACPGKNFRMLELQGKKVNPAPDQKTKSHSTKGANLTIDGKWGPATNKALQSALGTVVDGILSGQVHNDATDALYGGVEFGGGGSMVIRTLQKKIGSKADGLLGPNTVRALQKYLGTPQDGVISRPSSVVVEEMQQRLNKGNF